ncbi:homoserine O-succinyltransferase [Lactococcus kimchii]|uniref:homoserine O-succinyltransferase n=1 Tax=Lactococcus sp. S-13 TaxID=2507158 RepID=UPI001023F21A|nr:homoserine O-succinyltransferase [Lactococcus sp. S-13]RZI49104.1 homoserine O-succinyltransferase [Lactococcus sp. S-13]
MPVKVIKNLPAIEELRADNIFVMDSERAKKQNIRLLNLLVVNLMPRKLVTETQILRLLSNTPLQINVDFLYTATHEVKNTQQSHLDSFYKSFSQVKANYYDGLIVTGAPVEQLEFEAVDYWAEFLEIMNWSKSHVYSTLHICWGAQAGLYARYGVEKENLAQKLCGIFESSVENPKNPLFRGFDDYFYCPQSRYTCSDEQAITKVADLEVLSKSQEAGLSILAKKNLREVYLFGHLEYDRDTLAWEYQRDKASGLQPELPKHYFPEDDDRKPPKMNWASAASLFFSNWLNYAVYQGTPYVAERLSKHLEEDYDFNENGEEL